MQVIGATGSTVDNKNFSFVLVAANFPVFDQYQDATVGQAAVGLNNLSLIGGTASQLVDVDGTTGVSYTNDGLLFEDPTNAAPTNMNGILQNLQVANFPGNAFAANQFTGELRGYNVFAGNSGGNCVDFEQTANPYRFYGLVASGCASGVGINLDKTKSEEFHGASVFGNIVDVSVTGHTRIGGYILFGGAQIGGSDEENLYLDQQNETLLCAANCVFGTAWQGPCLTQACGAIEIGPDARNAATGNAPVIAELNQGIFSSATPYDVSFDADANTGNACRCRVALGPGMYDVSTSDGTGIPTTNDPTRLTGQTTYAPPVFANAASVGVPLTLNPNELGIGLSTDTKTAPKGVGVKLRIECATNGNGKVKVLLLTGGSSNPVTLFDNMGDPRSVPKCNQ